MIWHGLDGKKLSIFQEQKESEQAGADSSHGQEADPVGFGKPR